VGSAVAVGIAGFVAGAEALRATAPAWFLPVGAALGSLVWPALRLKVPRLYRLAWLTGTQAITLLLAVAYVATWVLHLVR
jgi:hypothetical protein